MDAYFLVMTVHDHPLNRFVYYYLKILGLCPFKISNTNILERCPVSTVYTCILSIMYLVVFIFMTKYRIGVMFSFETPMFVITKVLAGVLEFLAVMSIWMNGIFLQSLLRDIIRSFRCITNSLRPFGCHDDSSINVRRMNSLALLVYGGYMAMLIVDMIVHPTVGNDNWLVRIIFDSFRSLSHILTAFLIYALWMVKRHLGIINGFITTFSDSFRRTAIKGVINGRIVGCGSPVTCFRRLAQLREDLQDLLKMIESFVRSPILFFMLTHLVNIASYFYVICLHFTKVADVKITVTFLLFFGWLVINAAEVLATIHAVNAVVLEGNYTGNVFHRMIIEYYSPDVVDIVKVTSLRILQKPMKFSLYGLIDLNPSLLYRVSSAMATYFVILMQLDIQNELNEI